MEERGGGVGAFVAIFLGLCSWKVGNCVCLLEPQFKFDERLYIFRGPVVS